MAITKILARSTRLDAAVNYVINGDKTEDHILTAYLILKSDKKIAKSV